MVQRGDASRGSSTEPARATLLQRDDASRGSSTEPARARLEMWTESKPCACLGSVKLQLAKYFRYLCCLNLQDLHEHFSVTLLKTAAPHGNKKRNFLFVIRFEMRS